MQDPELTASGAVLVSLACLFQALFSRTRGPTCAQGGPGQRQPWLWDAALQKTVYFIFICQDLYKKGIVQL